MVKNSNCVHVTFYHEFPDTLVPCRDTQIMHSGNMEGAKRKTGMNKYSRKNIGLQDSSILRQCFYLKNSMLFFEDKSFF